MLTMKIMVGYRGKPGDQNSLDLAVKHARAFNGEIMLVTSMLGGEDVKAKEFTKAEAALEKAKEFVESQGIKAKTELLVRGFSAGEDLVSYSKEMQADEIIIRVRNRSKVGKLIFGSSAQLVILEAHCPVICVK
jgi:nucleotide-binding universal stress UspA family protein